MTIDSLIAEITSGGFQQYDEAGLIDYISLRTWIKNELKRFGGNLMNINEKILHVDNYRTKLPVNFWQLYLAMQCQPVGYTCEDKENILQNSLYFKERIEGTQEWDNTSESYVGKDFTYVREDYYFQKSKATFHYGNPTLLVMMKGFNRSVCSKDCENIRRKVKSENPNEINVVGDYMNTNFKKGVIYMQFYGLEVDENDQLLIPTTQHNRLKEYLIYYCRMRILEDLIIGDDDPNKVNMLSYFNQKQKEAFMIAMTEIKFEALANSNWKQVVRNKARIQTLKYDLMLPRR